MASIPPELQAHREWLGQIQQVGLVVSPQVLVNNQVFVDRHKATEVQVRLRELVDEPEDGGHGVGESPAGGDDQESGGVDFLSLVHDVLEWPAHLLGGAPGGPALPDAFTVALPEYDDTLSPTFAIPGPSGHDKWLGLVSVVPPATDVERPSEHASWRASPHARL